MNVRLLCGLEQPFRTDWRQTSYRPQRPFVLTNTSRSRMTAFCKVERAVRALCGQLHQHLNVIGALLSSGRLLMVKLWQSVNGLWFFSFLMTLIERVKKPMVVILDNA